MSPIHIPYSSPIVILSILIAIFASYISLELVSISINSTKKRKKKWLITSSLAMGLGIWTMHFTGLIAIRINGNNLELDALATIISLIVAIAGSLITFHFLMKKLPKKRHLILAGIFMGLSITSMHYIGMYAMNFNVYIEHHTIILLLSILIAFSGSFLTLFIFNKFSYRHLLLYQLPIAALLGIVISLMHYIAMNSFTLYDKPLINQPFLPTFSLSFDSNSMLNILILVNVIFYLIIYTLAMHNKRIQYQMYEMAFYDSLTKLPNRYYLEHQFQETLEHSASNNETFAVFFLDLNDFKEVNDRYGHEVGDNLLKRIADLLTSTVANHVVVSRYGGDEFIILAKQADEQLAHRMVEKIRNRFKTPLLLDNLEIQVTPSIGISFYPNDGTNMKTLIHHADQAMYKAKEKGKNQYGIY